MGVGNEQDDQEGTVGALVVAAAFVAVAVGALQDDLLDDLLDGLQDEDHWDDLRVQEPLVGALKSREGVKEMMLR